VSEMLWSDERIEQRMQSVDALFEGWMTIEEMMRAMRDEYEARDAQAARTIEHQAARIAELEGSLKKVEWW
jgi:hypothetical protein